MSSIESHNPVVRGECFGEEFHTKWIVRKLEHQHSNTGTNAAVAMGESNLTVNLRAWRWKWLLYIAPIFNKVMGVGSKYFQYQNELFS